MAPSLAVIPSDVDEAREALAGTGACVLPAQANGTTAGTAPPLVVLHPGAGSARRRWPPERFSALADALAGAGAVVAVVGTAAEQEIIGRLAAAARTPPFDLSGRLSLGGLVGILSFADLVVANDSGPLHLAQAVGAATVGLYWIGNLINAGPFGRARHRPVLSWRLDCPVCGLDSTIHHCGHDVSFLARIPVESVVEPALALLAEGRDAIADPFRMTSLSLSYPANGA